MNPIQRREFLRASSAVALSAAIPADLFAQSAAVRPPADKQWDAGTLRHLLPTVSDTRMLIKASFSAPLDAEPRLRVGDVTVRGRMSDTRGEHWHFHATDLAPGRRYALSLMGSRGEALCEPWQLSTFPSPGEGPDRFRLLIYTCGGGHEIHKFLPTAVRNQPKATSRSPSAAAARLTHSASIGAGWMW